MVIVLFVLVGFPLFVFFNVITSGLFILMLVVAGGIGVLGAMHYLLWGRSFSREVKSEREELEASEESEEWSYDTPIEPRRYGPF
jgi:hypothetical protein